MVERTSVSQHSLVVAVYANKWGILAKAPPFSNEPPELTNSRERRLLICANRATNEKLFQVCRRTLPTYIGIQSHSYSSNPNKYVEHST